MPPQARRPGPKTKIAFAVALAVLCALVVELGLQAAARVSPTVKLVLAPPWDTPGIAPTIPDEHLEYRPNPACRDHDRNGFRNPRVPDRADIVAMGDSHTYGTGVSSKHAWPRRLAALTHRSVYSMACGGYGPVHSLVLWDEAMALRPEVVIEAIYAGNDLYDAYNLVYNLGQLPELETRDPALLRAVEQAESTESFSAHVARLLHNGVSSRPEVPVHAVPADDRGSVRVWLSDHSALYGLLRSVRYEIGRLRDRITYDSDEAWRKAKAEAASNPDNLLAFSNGLCRTVFTPSYRLAALDVRDPRIREGERIAWEALNRMQQRARQDHVRFLVLLLPTKGLVFADQAAGVASTSYHETIDLETRFWSETKARLDARGIEYVEALPRLREELAVGRQPYQLTEDGHPNEHGHEVIARIVQEKLASSAQE